MKGVFIKPLDNIEEVKLLDEWRRGYWDADLEVPHDFKTADGAVDTVVATKEGKPIASLTGVHSIVLDPFIHDPNANPTDLLFSLVKMETALTFNAQKKGAVDAYIAVPAQLDKYIRLLQNYGWQPTVQNCVVLRRPLRPDTVPLLGEERDRALAEEARLAKEAHLASLPQEEDKIEEEV